MKAFTIILVEDNRADAGLVRASLDEHCVPGELVVISDGDTAIRFIDNLDAEAADCPDLVIIDLNLPKAPGAAVLRRMRRSVTCKDAVVVILSSSDVQREKDEVATLGANRFLRKPMRLEEFLALGAIFRDLLGLAPTISSAGPGSTSGGAL
jgi:DNA-binding response OmpR family regulator